MRRKLRYGLFVVVVLLAAAFWAALNWAGAKPAAQLGPQQLSKKDQQALPAPLQLLLPLHKQLGKPDSTDWLANHEEAGETYRQFLAGSPIRATAKRRTIWIQPLGSFTPDERKIVDLAAEFLGHFFQLPVQVAEDQSLSVIPEEARRNHPFTGESQILSTYVLDQVLKPNLPEDAVVSLALTAKDLWPGENWNFVFGQASLQDRVGVWSIHRFGDASQGKEAFQLALRRTLKTAAHETGHMFSLPHCVHFDCVMNGSNHLQEADSQPLWACPQCLAKLQHATGADLVKRFQALAEFARVQELATEQEFWEKSLRILETPAKGK